MATHFGIFLGLLLSNPSSGAIPANTCETSAALTGKLLGTVTLCVIGAKSQSDVGNCLKSVPLNCPWTNCWSSYTSSVYQAGVQNLNACSVEFYSDACMALVGTYVGALGTCMGSLLVPPKLPIGGSCTLREVEAMVSVKESGAIDPIEDFLSKRLSIDSKVVSANCATCYSSFVSSVGSIIQSQEVACGDLINNRGACFQVIATLGAFA